MAAFKDKNNGNWYVQFRYTDWQGNRQQKLKRGFTTKHEAQAWEREFLIEKKSDINMSLGLFLLLHNKLKNKLPIRCPGEPWATLCKERIGSKMQEKWCESA